MTLADFSVAQTVTIGEQKIIPDPYFKKRIFTVGITRSLVTRRTLRITKFLRCINKAQPERSGSWSDDIKITAPEPEPCLRKQRASEPEPFHFYKSSAALVQTL